MKRLVLICAAAALAGCGKSPEKAAIADNAAVLQKALEAEADNMEALADNAADPAAEQAYENVADTLKAAKREFRRDAKQARQDAP